MKALAQLIMRGPMSASAVTATAGFLSLLLPPLSFISAAALALVVLARGAGAGLRVLIRAALALFLVVAALAADLGEGFKMAFGFLAVVWAPLLVAAASLRRTGSQPRALLLAGLFGAVVAVGFFLVQTDPAGWWHERFKEMIAKAGGPLQANPDLAAMLAELAPLMTGVVAASLTVSVAGSLLLARWWQALLYNPGGFRREFQELRLGRALGAATLLMGLLASLPSGGFGLLALNLLLITGVLHLLQGIAVVHGLVQRNQASVGWLMAMYVLLVAMPHTGLTLAFAGLADNWFDFRVLFGSAERD